MTGANSFNNLIISRDNPWPLEEWDSPLEVGAENMGRDVERMRRIGIYVLGVCFSM